MSWELSVLQFWEDKWWKLLTKDATFGSHKMYRITSTLTGYLGFGGIDLQT